MELAIVVRIDTSELLNGKLQGSTLFSCLWQHCLFKLRRLWVALQLPVRLEQPPKTDELGPCHKLTS